MEIEILEIEIFKWFDKNSKPNPCRAYFRCPVCNLTWTGEGLFGKERHEHSCWIPLIKMTDTKKGREKARVKND